VAIRSIDISHILRYNFNAVNSKYDSRIAETPRTHTFQPP